MYDTIQHILTLFFNAIAIIGFLCCWVHYCATTTLIEIRRWGTPQSIPNSVEKNREMKRNDLNDFHNSTVMNELKSNTTTHNISIWNDLPANDTNQPKNQPLTFQGYSKTRLRKIARELEIRRYTQMEREELMTAITSHPAAQQAYCTH